MPARGEGGNVPGGCWDYANTPQTRKSLRCEACHFNMQLVHCILPTDSQDWGSYTRNDVCFANLESNYPWVGILSPRCVFVENRKRITWQSLIRSVMPDLHRIAFWPAIHSMQITDNYHRHCTPCTFVHSNNKFTFAYSKTDTLVLGPDFSEHPKDPICTTIVCIGAWNAKRLYLKEETDGNS